MESKKLLIVYNTCQIGNQGNCAYYVDAIRSILAQDFPSYDLVLSGCMMTNITVKQLQSTFEGAISYSLIDESLPLGITFNHTVRKCVERFGEYEGYLYVDSGINFWNNPRAISIMWERFKTDNYGIVAAMPSNDDGKEWWGIKYDDDRDFIYPLGKTTNMHVQIFHNDFYQAYGGRILPDLFASDSSESIFTFMCAALEKKMLMVAKNDLHLMHVHSMDGASVGWRNKEFLFRQPGSTKQSMTPIWRNGRAFGFGYEECEPHWPHDPNAYNDRGFPHHPGLKNFIQENCFAKYDYSYIAHRFLPNR